MKNLAAFLFLAFGAGKNAARNVNLRKLNEGSISMLNRSDTCKQEEVQLGEFGFALSLVYAMWGRWLTFVQTL